jgi:hypothetical protein
MNIYACSIHAEIRGGTYVHLLEVFKSQTRADAEQELKAYLLKLIVNEQTPEDHIRILYIDSTIIKPEDFND